MDEGVTETLPALAGVTVPTPLSIEHEVAFVEDHVRFDALPAVILDGLATRVADVDATTVRVNSSTNRGGLLVPGGTGAPHPSPKQLI